MKTALVILLLTSCMTQYEKSDITIEKIKEIYSPNDTLQLVLTNKANKILFYYIGVECYINKEWLEIVNDINNPLSKSSMLSKLQVNQENGVSFFINKVSKDYIPDFNSYRLKINYGTNVDTINKQVFSKTFKIEK